MSQWGVPPPIDMNNTFNLCVLKTPFHICLPLRSSVGGFDDDLSSLKSLKYEIWTHSPHHQKPQSLQAWLGFNLGFQIPRDVKYPSTTKA